MRKIIIVGGGASGLMACCTALTNPENEIILIEKNEKLGKKIYITGKGRCNLTNDVDPSEFFSNVVNNPKFLFSSIYTFAPQNTIDFFENNGLKIKIERGNRVFPLSDKSSDVIKTFEKILNNNRVKIMLNTLVKDLIIENGAIKGVKTDNGIFYADSVLIATGGISYPLTGSTGDGYTFAKKVGHKIIPPIPALCGIVTETEDVKKLQGLTLKNVRLTVKNLDKTIHEDFGELLFTHFGISGPLVLTCSSIINRLNFSNLKILLDLKPALSIEKLDARITRDISEEFSNKTILSLLRNLAPSSLADVLIKRLGVSKDRKCSNFSKQERERLIILLKNFEIKIRSLRPISEAIVTSGGISVKEINPKTMESKLVKNLFFAGEVLDVDAFTGGFNLQIAFSTGYSAGLNL